MAPATATLTVKATTPYSAQLRFEATAGSQAAYLKKSGATGGDVDLTSLAMGPLRACLQQSSNWSTLTGKLIVRLTMEGIFSSVDAPMFSYTPNGNQGQPGAPGAFADWANDNVFFSSTAGPCIATIELRFLASNCR
jgi:hypothetical protein